MKKSVSIIGFGRFGKTLYRLFRDSFDVTVSEINSSQYKAEDYPEINFTNDLTEVYKSDTTFLRCRFLALWMF